MAFRCNSNHRAPKVFFQVLRTELRQREEFVSRLISDGERNKSHLVAEKKRTASLKSDYESLAAEVSAKDALLKDYEANDVRMKKLVFKYQSQIEGTYDGDEDLKNIIKDKIEEIEKIKSNHDQLLKQIRRLKKKYRKKKFKIQATENQNAYATDGTESTTGSVVNDSQPPTQDVEDVQNIQKQITEAEMNPDEYVSCSIQQKCNTKTAWIRAIEILEFAEIRIST